jgi:DNA-binding NarL/FixJ family response regulator
MEEGETPMRRLIFIDDDRTELADFKKIVGDDYEYVSIHWPGQETKLWSVPVPDIFVSDLYLPGPGGDKVPTAEEQKVAENATTEVGERFRQLFANQNLDDKERLRETMRIIDAAYGALKLQWSALGQSPDHGVDLCRKLKNRYSNMPFVFYSRKITPEDVVRVLQAGATDAIRKGAFGKREVLARLDKAQQIFHATHGQKLRALGMNVNLTVISAESAAQESSGGSSRIR